MARAFVMPYKYIIIGILIIIFCIFYKPLEGFESIFSKTLDRMNPLAASQNPLNEIVPTGISEGDGVKSRLMNQMALNIPTVSLAYESGVNTWAVLAPQCNKANTYVEPNPAHCTATGMRQKYLYQSDAGGACIETPSGDPFCDDTCPGANTQGGCNYHACDKTGQVPFSEVTDISQCDALGNRQAYVWASSPSGSCIQNISGSPTCDAIRCPGANTLNGCAYCDTSPSTKVGCAGYDEPYTCTRADTPPVDSCSNYKKRPVSWTNPKATATNAAACTAKTYGTAVCDSSCNPPQQSTDASGCNYVAPYVCTRADNPPADTCSSYKKRPVSWTYANKATITNAADCSAKTYGTAVCDPSCSPPTQSTNASVCGYVAPAPRCERHGQFEADYSSTGMKQNYFWGSAYDGTCVRNNNGPAICDSTTDAAKSVAGGGCYYCSTDAVSKPTCPGYCPSSRAGCPGFVAKHPGKPTLMSWSPSSFNTLNVSWGRPADDGGSPITGYHVTVYSDDNHSVALQSSTTSASTSVVNYDTLGTGASQTYYIEVYAINSVGNGEVASNVART